MIATRELQEQQRAILGSALSVTGWTGTHLAKKAGVAASTLNRFLNNEDVTHALSIRTLMKVQEAVSDEVSRLGGVSPDEFVHSFDQLTQTLRRARDVVEGTERLDSSLSAIQPQTIDRIHGRSFLDSNLPILGEARGGQDGFFFNSGLVKEYVPRPAVLQKASNAYAVFVNGETMEPRFFHGELVYANPNRPPRAGDFVVVELSDGQGLIKRFLRWTASMLLLGQYQPRKEIEVPSNSVKAVHLIVGSAIG